MQNLNLILSSILSGIILFYLAIIIIVIAGMWKTYEKAGQPGWACIVPIYNILILLKIVGKPWWWILLFLVPLVNLVFIIWVTNLVSKSFGKSEGFTVGLVLLGFIFYPILGFGDATYQGPSAVEARGGNSLQELKDKLPA
ncbi:MAG: DUF5684 domain-containing protein [Sphingobacteriaceae bacterium]